MLVLLSLAACSEEDQEKAGDAALAAADISAPEARLQKHPETGERLARKQVLVRGNASEPASLDPQLAEDTVGGAIVVDLFEGLTRSGPEGDTEPALAKSWASSDNNLTWTFHLREDARWSDGTGVTAHDFVYGWRRAVDPEVGSNYAYYLESAGVANAGEIIAGEKPPQTLGVRALDDFTFEVSLDEPITYLPDMTVHYTMFPAPRQAIEAHGADWTKPGKMVSNGAYVLQTWHLGEKLVAARNPYYHGDDQTIIDRVVYVPIESASAELQRYASGELHMTSTVPVSQMARLKKERPDELVMAPSIATYMYTFNVHRPPFDDVRVRRALTYAID
ncbi:MAG TPA: peptide ABC transporter substrate-binding protein, partial [Marinobacter sp.]